MFAKLRQVLSDALDSSAFVIRIADGRLQVTKGRLPQRFLADMRELIAGCAIASGVIRGQRKDTYIRLSFSADIPPEMHQKLRNIWHAHEPAFQTDAP